MFTRLFVDQAYKTIRDGGLSLVKADIGYGLLGSSEMSIKRMYQIKGRPYSNPAIIAGNFDTLKEVTIIDPPVLWDWLKIMTAKTTLAVVAKVNPHSSLLKTISPWTYQQATLNNTIAVFLNAGEYIDRMVELAYHDHMLLVGSSGNLSSRGNHYRFDEVEAEIINQVDFYYDAGTCKYENPQKQATTIINLTNMTVRRKGVQYDTILASYQPFAENNHLSPLVTERK